MLVSCVGGVLIVLAGGEECTGGSQWVGNGSSRPLSSLIMRGATTPASTASSTYSLNFVTTSSSNMSGFPSLNNGETAEGWGPGSPFGDRSSKTPIKPSKSRLVSIFAETSALEGRDFRGVDVETTIFEGISWVGDNSEGGAAPVDGGVDGSLTTVRIEFRAGVTAKFSPRGGLDLVADRKTLSQGLGCKERE